MSHTSQIFQTSSASRWRSFKWSFRILMMVIVFFFVVFAIALIRGSNPSALNIKSLESSYQSKLTPSHLGSSQNKKYKGFKSFLLNKIKTDSLRALQPLQPNALNNLPILRAAFYTPWTAKVGLPDLAKYGHQLNTIFPEWFFIDTANHFRLQTRIDSAGLALMRSKGLRIMPILNNFNSTKRGIAGNILPDFDGDLLHGILNNPVKQQQFIQQLVDTLSFYHFEGINIDFEELKESSNTPLSNFQQNLYAALHARNLTVTMDVSVKNEDYDYKKLAASNDYIVLMAYDQFASVETGPGPISGQKWIEEALDWTAARIPRNKIILGVAGYGYDWTTDEEGKKAVRELSYAQAVNMAKIAHATIDYDDDSYNLHFNYTEQHIDNESGLAEQMKHDVWFTDAATIFNVLRFSDEYATAGTALWHIGVEDSRMWQFYSRDLSNDALQKNPFDFNSLVNIPADINQKPTSTGEGELLTILYSPQAGKIDVEVDSTELLITEQRYKVLPSGYVYQKFGQDKTPMGPGHKIILTFDDGPSPEFTPQILDILEKEKIPATFFVVGINTEQNIPLLQRIYRNGFEIGNHTFTHGNLAKMSPQRAEMELKSTRFLIESITGRSTILFRAPYNADSEPQTYEELEPLARSKKDNYINIGESIDPNDWQTGVSADSIVERTIRLAESTDGSIILLHDAGGETRKATIEALPRLIAYFKKRGCVFTTVADLMGKKKNDVMPLLADNRDSWMRNLNYFLAVGTYWSGHIIFALFLIGIFLSIARMIFMGILAGMQKKKEASVPMAIWPADKMPLVSIIVPAYNEELNAVRTVNSLLAQDYSNLQVIFIDDGSKDSTYEKVSAAFKNIPNVKVYTKPNGGKAVALNGGIAYAESDYVVCIDADTQLKTDAVTQLMKKFTNDKVGAVAGNVKVGNERNMITRWQSIEYVTSQNFDRRAFDLLNCITVVPGAIGAFKKEAVIAAGGFTTDTLAEDCDLTMRLHRLGYQVNNSNDAISYTEAPETMKQFMKQRFRWSFGVMQCFWKHRDTVFNPKYKNLGMVAMPNILIYQLILPFLSPLADLVLVLALIAAGFGWIPASVGHIFLYYALFTLVDVAGAALAFAFEKESYKKLIWMIPQRLVYRQLMYYIIIKSFNRAIKGELQGWGVLKRTGNVKQMVGA